MKLTEVKSSEDEIATAELSALIEWLTSKSFEPPDFEWAALSVNIETSGPGKDWGFGGYFYDNNGRWAAARFRPWDERREAGESSLFEDFVRSTSSKLRRNWRAVLVQLIRHGEEVSARLEFDFKNMQRWSSLTHESRLPDVMRPAELPAPDH